MCSQQTGHSSSSEWLTPWRAVLLFRGSQKGWRNMLTEISWSSTKTNAKPDILLDNHIQHPGWRLAAWVGRKKFYRKKPGDPGREPIMYWSVIVRMQLAGQGKWLFCSVWHMECCSGRTGSSFNSPEYWSTAVGCREGWRLKYVTNEEMVKELCFQPKEALKGKSYWFLCLSSSKKDGCSSSQWMQKWMTRGYRNLWWKSAAAVKSS